MRMNRVCRMVLVTSVGSFILVIFYFQSMLLPGRALPLRSALPAAGGGRPGVRGAGGNFVGVRSSGAPRGEAGMDTGEEGRSSALRFPSRGCRGAVDEKSPALKFFGGVRRCGAPRRNREAAHLPPRGAVLRQLSAPPKLVPLVGRTRSLAAPIRAGSWGKRGASSSPLCPLRIHPSEPGKASPERFRSPHGAASRSAASRIELPCPFIHRLRPAGHAVRVHVQRIRPRAAFPQAVGELCYWDAKSACGTREVKRYFTAWL